MKCVLNGPKCIQEGCRPFFHKFWQKFRYLKGRWRYIFESNQISLIVNLLWVFQCENHNWFGWTWFGLAIRPETNFTSEILSISPPGWLKSKIPKIYVFPISKGICLWIQKVSWLKSWLFPNESHRPNSLGKTVGFSAWAVFCNVTYAFSVAVHCS